MENSKTMFVMAKNNTINVKGIVITILTQKEMDYISFTDMLKATDGDSFISTN